MNLALILGDNQEEDIDQMISGAKIYEDNQGMERIFDDSSHNLVPSLEMSPPKEDHEQAQQNNFQKRKRKRVQDLLTSLYRLSEGLSAATSVAERQIIVLQDLHSGFLASCEAKTGDCKEGYQFWQGSSRKGITLIPIPLEYPQQIWPNTLDIIADVVLERRRFVEKIQTLVQKMEAGRKSV